jgi:2-dehydropantoate 2-reductase
MQSVVPFVPIADSSKPFDYVVVTMKNIPEVCNITEIIKPAITPNHTAVVLIQNGLNIEPPVIEAFPRSVVLSGVSFIGAHQINGSVIHDDHDQMSLGAFHNPNLDVSVEKAKAEEFASVYAATTPTCTVVDDIVYMRWRKVLWNGIFNPMCAITQLNSASIRLYGGEYSLIRPALAEMANIARADGYNLPDDIVDEMIDSTSIELSFRPSMLVDVDKGNPMEAEVILGNPLRIARKHGVATPILDNTYRFLKLTQSRLLEARGLVTPPKDLPTGDFI